MKHSYVFIFAMLLFGCDVQETKKSSDIAAENLVTFEKILHNPSTGDTTVKSSIGRNDVNNSVIFGESRFLTLGRGDSYYVQKGDNTYPLTLDSEFDYSANFISVPEQPIKTVLSRQGQIISSSSITLLDGVNFEVSIDTNSVVPDSTVSASINIDSASGIFPEGFYPDIKVMPKQATCTLADNSVPAKTITDRIGPFYSLDGDFDNGVIIVDVPVRNLFIRSSLHEQMSEGVYRFCDLEFDIFWTKAYLEPGDLQQIAAIEVDSAILVEFVTDTLKVRVVR